MIDIGTAAVIGGSVVLGLVGAFVLTMERRKLYRDVEQARKAPDEGWLVRHRAIVQQQKELQTAKSDMRDLEERNVNTINSLLRCQKRGRELEREILVLTQKLAVSEERRREVEQDYLSSSSWSSSKSE